MVQRLITIDDLDGSEGAEATSFAVEGVRFVIDLTEPNRKALYEALLPFIKKARRPAGSGRMPEALRAMVGDIPAVPGMSTSRGPDVAKVHTKADLRAVRAFAVDYGIKISPGRIPQDVWNCWRSKAPDGHPDFSLLDKSRRPSAKDAP